MIAILLLFCELFFLKSIIARLGIANAISLIFFISFFYCNAQVIDLVLLGVELTGFEATGVIVKFDTLAFNMAAFMYFLFMLGLFIFSFSEKVNVINNLKPKAYVKIPRIFIIIMILLMLTIFYRNSFLTRLDIKYSGSLVDLFVHNAILFSFALIIFKGKIDSLFLNILLWLSFLLYAIFSYEREPLVFLFLVFLFKYHKRINYIIVAPLSAIVLVCLTYFKAFYLLVLGLGDWDLFYDYVSKRRFSLSRLDPEASYSILYDYFDSNPSFYDDYTFSYFKSFLIEVSRLVFGGDKYQTMGKTASQFYVEGNYGIASSMILESILNFSYLGPIIVSFMIIRVYFWLKVKFESVGFTIDVLYVLLFVSLIRTEFIVILKIYILPFIILLLLSNSFVKKASVIKINK